MQAPSPNPGLCSGCLWDLPSDTGPPQGGGQRAPHPPPAPGPRTVHVVADAVGAEPHKPVLAGQAQAVQRVGPQLQEEVESLRRAGGMVQQRESRHLAMQTSAALGKGCRANSNHALTSLQTVVLAERRGQSWPPPSEPMEAVTFPQKLGDMAASHTRGNSGSGHIAPAQASLHGPGIDSRALLRTLSLPPAIGGSFNWSPQMTGGCPIGQTL